MGQNYPSNMAAAAHRHLLAGEQLVSGHRKDVAGYLYGLAAECGLKALMLTLGVKPLPPEQRRDDPFFAHFTVLKTLLIDSDQGRKHHDLRKFAQDQNCMAHWDTSMRYSDGKSIDDRWVESWRNYAKAIIAEI